MLSYYIIAKFQFFLYKFFFNIFPESERISGKSDIGLDQLLFRISGRISDIRCYILSKYPISGICEIEFIAENDQKF